MATRRETQRIERDRRKLIALSTLAGGRTPYAQARAGYERQIGGKQAADAFAQLVQNLIAEKLIDFAADPSAGAPGIAMLWLRPKGMAWLREGGPAT